MKLPKYSLALLSACLGFAIQTMAQQDNFHDHITMSVKWTDNGFDYTNTEVKVPLPDDDMTHSFTSVKQWHIPFAHVASVSLTDTGGTDISVTVMLKSEMNYKDTESSYSGNSQDYIDHSIVCYVRPFKNQQDAEDFINQIKSKIGSNQSSSQ